MSTGAVIFLDFDGVVITTRSRWAALTPEGFDPVATRWLSQLIQQASAQVVISSAWRRGETRVSMLELLARKGMPEVPLHEDWATPLHGRKPSEFASRARNCSCDNDGRRAA